MTRLPIIGPVPFFRIVFPYVPFSRPENLGHAGALHFMHYNFCRVHQTLKRTPAMASGLADHAWKIEELFALLDGPVSN